MKEYLKWLVVPFVPMALLIGASAIEGLPEGYRHDPNVTAADIARAKRDNAGPSGFAIWQAEEAAARARKEAHLAWLERRHALGCHKHDLKDLKHQARHGSELGVFEALSVMRACAGHWKWGERDALFGD